MIHNWNTTAIVLTAPFRKDIDKVLRLIDEYLAPKGCNMIVLQVRYRYDFHSHPECRGMDPLTYDDVKKFVAVCKKHNIKLVPKMNLIGHQSGLPNNPSDSILHGHPAEVRDIRDGLLRAYPEFDEQPEEKTVNYSRSICLSNPAVKHVVFDLMDELLEVFEADTIHVGCDEVFNIGFCDLCKDTPVSELFANWINTLHDHLAENGKKMMMWSDRFLKRSETPYDIYESAENGTEDAINLVAKDILCCDWHHAEYDTFPSVDIYAKAGLRMLVSPAWRIDRLKKFIAYAKEHDKGHIEGLLITTWCNSGELSDVILEGKPGIWYRTEMVAESIRVMLEEEA